MKRELLDHAIYLAGTSPLRLGGRSCGCVLHLENGVVEACTTPSRRTWKPADMADPEERKLARHAEPLAVAEAARLGLPTEGGDAYVSWFPCAPCASVLAAAGIARLYCGMEFAAPSGEYDFDRAREILADAGVEVVEVTT